ncbi:hypothetical protein F2P81_003313 [Scophthalmus maximus]|uniref:Uncharacterized protein n=1 Tax=Scophthalmus maximus TaxID=52904 RepID=A0A6A4TG35_SCOMX|nr:hypothetical protein F2P81_003313 [Scophthalmus maximus]
MGDSFLVLDHDDWMSDDDFKTQFKVEKYFTFGKEWLSTLRTLRAHLNRDISFLVFEARIPDRVLHHQVSADSNSEIYQSKLRFDFERCYTQRKQPQLSCDIVERAATSTCEPTESDAIAA